MVASLFERRGCRGRQCQKGIKKGVVRGSRGSSLTIGNRGGTVDTDDTVDSVGTVDNVGTVGTVGTIGAVVSVGAVGTIGTTNTATKINELALLKG